MTAQQTQNVSEFWQQAADMPSPVLVQCYDHEDVLRSLVLQAFERADRDQEPESIEKKMDAGSHPDWISVAGDDSMDQLRDALYELRHKSFLSKIRVFTVKHLEDANPHFQNALLKTLEEPEAHWKIFLSVDSIHSVLPTIRSRCLQLRMPPDSTPIELKDSSQQLYSAIRDSDEIQIFSKIDKVLASRESFRHELENMSMKASEERWPGHWRHLAPFIDTVFAELDRNLNPKIVWEHLWLNSLEAKEEGFL